MHTINTVSYNIKCMCNRRKTGESLCDPRLYPSCKTLHQYCLCILHMRNCGSRCLYGHCWPL